jgi:hypothetical protein
MENAVTLGVLYLIIGGLLLFFGWRFIRLIAGLYGFLIGLWLGSLVSDMFNATGGGAFFVTLLVAIALAAVAIAFYTFVVAGLVGFLIFTIAYGIANSLTDAWGLNLAVAVLAGLLGFILIRRYKLIDLALIVLTAVQGAGAVATGAAILLDHSRAESLIHGNIAVITNTVSAPWIIGWIALAMLGFVIQTRDRYDAKTT